VSDSLLSLRVRHCLGTCLQGNSTAHPSACPDTQYSAYCWYTLRILSQPGTAVRAFTSTKSDPPAQGMLWQCSSEEPLGLAMSSSPTVVPTPSAKANVPANQISTPSVPFVGWPGTVTTPQSTRPTQALALTHMLYAEGSRTFVGCTETCPIAASRRFTMTCLLQHRPAPDMRNMRSTL
jgi:hypothetical protein